MDTTHKTIVRVERGPMCVARVIQSESQVTSYTKLQPRRIAFLAHCPQRRQTGSWGGHRSHFTSHRRETKNLLYEVVQYCITSALLFLPQAITPRSLSLPLSHTLAVHQAGRIEHKQASKQAGIRWEKGGAPPRALPRAAATTRSRLGIRRRHGGERRHRQLTPL
jgi:hypothetical protein